MTIKTGVMRQAGAVLVAAMLLLPAVGQAEMKVVPVEGVGYDVGASLVDNLRTLVGKRVYVTLDSGKVFAGTVKEVGDHLLHLEKLDRKDFFDGLIRIDSIGAIDTRFRMPAR